MFLSLLSSGLGVVLGAYLTNRYNRKAKFDELNVQLLMEKHNKYNQLWDALAYVRAIIENTPDFVALWNVRHVSLIPAFRKAVFDAHEKYMAISSQMSFQMGSLYEYLTKYLLEGRLLGPMDVPLKINEEQRQAIIRLYQSGMQLMMDLLKEECNQQAIEALMFGKEKAFNEAIENYGERMRKFIASHNEFEQIKKILEGMDNRKI
jgi:hypothetical protein